MFQIFGAQPPSSNIKSLVKKTLTTTSTCLAAQHNIIMQCYCLGTRGLIEDRHR